MVNRDAGDELSFVRQGLSKADLLVNDVEKGLGRARNERIFGEFSHL